MSWSVKTFSLREEAALLCARLQVWLSRLAATCASALAFSLAGLLWSPVTHAAVVLDFEGLNLGWNGIFLGNGQQSWDIASAGFDVRYVPGDFAIVNDNRGQGALFSGNGSTRMITANGGSIFISDPSGASFDALSFHGGETWIGQPHYWATSIRVTGYYATGGITTQDFALDLIKDPVMGMETFTLNGNFRGLSAIRFSGIGGNPDFSLDNLVLTPVPELPTAALMLAGLAGVALRRLRASD